ncbi:MAG: TetR/AcrR family transcriptional regulator [Chloroflexi bacterium]|nr:MAG: TetR/AcrR family transcriptional regulator [Chloroflexota bacterium]
MVRVSRTRSRISSARMALPPRRGSGRRAYSDRPLPARPGPRRLNESSFSGEGRAMRAMGGEERGDRRRTQILDAAARVFAERGYHRTTVRDIAREAGIADGTIYLYFSSKQELLLGLIAQLGRFAERRADFAEAGAMDLRDFSRSYLALRFEQVRETRHLFTAVLPEILADAELREGFSERVTEAYEAADAELARRARRGELGDLDPQLLTRVAAATGLGLLVLAILEEPVLAERWDELPEFLTRLWFDGLPRERG